MNIFQMMTLYIKLILLKNLWPWIKIKAMFKTKNSEIGITSIISLCGIVVCIICAFFLYLVFLLKGFHFTDYLAILFFIICSIFGLEMLSSLPLNLINLYRNLKPNKVIALNNHQQKIEELTQVLIEKRRLDHHLPPAQNPKFKKRL